MKELDWPAQSRDLNPIKHLLDELERRLRARPSHPTSVYDVKNALLSEWANIHTDALKILGKKKKSLPEEWSYRCKEENLRNTWI